MKKRLLFFLFLFLVHPCTTQPFLTSIAKTCEGFFKGLGMGAGKEFGKGLGRTFTEYKSYILGGAAIVATVYVIRLLHLSEQKTYIIRKGPLEIKQPSLKKSRLSWKNRIRLWCAKKLVSRS